MYRQAALSARRLVSEHFSSPTDLSSTMSTTSFSLILLFALMALASANLYQQQLPDELQEVPLLLYSYFFILF